MRIEVDRHTPIELAERLPIVRQVSKSVIERVSTGYHERLEDVRYDQELEREEVLLLEYINGDSSAEASWRCFPGAQKLAGLVCDPFVRLVLNEGATEADGQELSRSDTMRRLMGLPTRAEKIEAAKHDTKIQQSLLIGLRAERLLLHVKMGEADVWKRAVQLLSLIDSIYTDSEVSASSEEHPIWQDIDLDKEDAVKLRTCLQTHTVSYEWVKAAREADF